jgi:hypothetical protein
MAREWMAREWMAREWDGKGMGCPGKGMGCPGKGMRVASRGFCSTGVCDRIAVLGTRKTHAAQTALDPIPLPHIPLPKAVPVNVFADVRSATAFPDLKQRCGGPFVAARKRVRTARLRAYTWSSDGFIGPRKCRDGGAGGVSATDRQPLRTHVRVHPPPLSYPLKHTLENRCLR